MTEAAATPQPKNGKIFAQVANYIEHATRFDGNDVSAVEPEIEADGFVNFKLVQQVRISAKTKETRGRLPNWVDDVFSASEMQNVMRKRLAETNAKLPAAIENWVNDDDGSYMRLMPTHLVKLPRGAGWEWKCRPCGGAGNVACPISGCYNGRVNCYTCYGRREVSCSSCSGSGDKSCSSCHGSGSLTLYQNSQTLYQTCSNCYGRGRTACYGCHSSGKVQCTTCWGAGNTQCSTCSGTSRITCSTCCGQRWLNEFGSFEVDIDVHKQDHQVQTIDNASATLLGQIDLRDLPDYGALVHHSHQSAMLSAHSSYTFQVPHQKASLQADNAAFTIYGFGAQAKVFSYENIVGHLLQKDLSGLRMSLRTDKQRRYTGQVDVLDRLADFTRSELNMVLAEELTGAKPNADLHAAVEAKYSGLVSKTYIAEASTAFQRAISHVYQAKVSGATFSLVGISLMLGIIFGILHWPTAHWLATGALTFIVCGVLWVLAENHAQRSIAGHFEGALGQRILDLSQQASNIKGWRRWVWIALAVCAFGGAFAAGQFGTVNAWMQDWLVKTF